MSAQRYLRKVKLKWAELPDLHTIFFNELQRCSGHPYFRYGISDPGCGET